MNSKSSLPTTDPSASRTSRTQPSIRSFFTPTASTDNAVAPTTSHQPSQPSQPPPMQQLTPQVALQVTLPAMLPILPSPPSLPDQASVASVEQRHVAALRGINSLLLPVHYPDAFYTRVLDPLASGLFSRVLLWCDRPGAEPKVVGGLVCRLEPSPFINAAAHPVPYDHAAHLVKMRQQVSAQESATPVTHAIYIQSLTLLSPYRGLGLASAALEHVLASAAMLAAMPDSDLRVCTVYAHVWTDNEDALRWYEARGFAREGTEPQRGYYFKLKPDTAWIVRRDIGEAHSHAAAGQPRASPAVTTPPVPNILTHLVDSPPADGSMKPKTSVSPAPPSNSSSQPPSTLVSFQTARPETEWNDLPADVISGGVGGRPLLKAPGSGGSSRSSSSARKKKDRSYPAAAYGS